MQRYLKYVLKNIEPIRIADDSTSQNGQTNCLRYIPGTSVRGVIINALSGEKDFEQIKKTLFSNDVRYLNAYLMADERELLPSPKGFYEDKRVAAGKKEIQNVVSDGTFTEGYKRASLGRYCYFEEDCIRFFSVPTGSDMKIKINVGAGEKKNVFRNEYVCEGNRFCGYIAVNDEDLAKRFSNILKGTVMIGNGRSAGLGKCRVLSCEYIEALPYGEYVPDEDLRDSCYMFLLSNTVMRGEEGEYCGLDMNVLKSQMGVESLSIEACSTSTVEVKGHNRVWGVKTPSVVMYEQGSVFRLGFSGTLTKERIRRICDEGIGVRKNEGFGRVLFLKHYDSIRFKLTGETKRDMPDSSEEEREDREVLRIAAKALYRKQLHDAAMRFILQNPLPRSQTSSSQLGILESFASSYRYEPDQAYRSINAYFEHAAEKSERQNVHKKRNSITGVEKLMRNIMDKPLTELLQPEDRADSIMGIHKSQLLSETEEKQFRLNLMTEMIRYENKKG